jgi:hypothetical protein
MDQKLVPFFKQLKTLEENVKTAKDDVWDNYSNMTPDQQDQGVQRIRVAKSKLYAAIDSLTPDEIRAYGEFRKLVSA